MGEFTRPGVGGGIGGRDSRSKTEGDIVGGTWNIVGGRDSRGGANHPAITPLASAATPPKTEFEAIRELGGVGAILTAADMARISDAFSIRGRAQRVEDFLASIHATPPVAAAPATKAADETIRNLNEAGAGLTIGWLVDHLPGLAGSALSFLLAARACQDEMCDSERAELRALEKIIEWGEKARARVLPHRWGNATADAIRGRVHELAGRAGKSYDDILNFTPSEFVAAMNGDTRGVAAALDANMEKILHRLFETHPRLLTVVEMSAVDIGRDAVRVAINGLKAARLCGQPKGKRKGWGLTPTGLALAQKRR